MAKTKLRTLGQAMTSRQFMEALEKSLARRGLSGDEVKWVVRQKATRLLARQVMDVPAEIGWNTRTTAAKLADILMLGFEPADPPTERRPKRKPRLSSRESIA